MCCVCSGGWWWWRFSSTAHPSPPPSHQPCPCHRNTQSALFRSRNCQNKRWRLGQGPGCKYLCFSFSEFPFFFLFFYLLVRGILEGSVGLTLDWLLWLFTVQLQLQSLDLKVYVALFSLVSGLCAITMSKLRPYVNDLTVPDRTWSEGLVWLKKKKNGLTVPTC